jgi:F0F1-type ATP synthase membrane subunit a
VTTVTSTVVTGVNNVVKPQVAAAVASSFSFPLALMVFVFVFLLAQSRVDRLDPKLRVRPDASADLMLGFEDEDLL